MTRKEFQQRFSRRARKAGAAAGAELSSKLWAYFELLFRWNERINLTSLTLESPDEAIDRLLIEPLIAAKQVLPSETRFIDIGSGGGSPAIPLALAAPHARIVMVESKARKSAFLREALRQLELSGGVETARFEELLTRPDFHENFDLLTIRAVRLETRTLTTLQAFVRPNGRLFLFRRTSSRPDAWIAPPLRLHTVASLTSGSELAVLEKLLIP